jgi:hypothetical protein
LFHQIVNANVLLSLRKKFSLKMFTKSARNKTYSNEQARFDWMKQHTLDKSVTLRESSL